MVFGFGQKASIRITLKGNDIKKIKKLVNDMYKKILIIRAENEAREKENLEKITGIDLEKEKKSILEEMKALGYI